jgi:predicted Rossmann-fold nucleotide-binding protein
MPAAERHRNHGARRVLVCGGRDYDDREQLYAALDKLHAKHRFSIVIAGGAKGADTLARDWAKLREVPVKVYVAAWERFGPKAGPIRNQRMLEKGKPDLVIAFPGGHGTADMVEKARQAGVEILVLSR